MLFVGTAHCWKFIWLRGGTFRYLPLRLVHALLVVFANNALEGVEQGVVPMVLLQIKIALFFLPMPALSLNSVFPIRANLCLRRAFIGVLGKSSSCVPTAAALSSTLLVQDWIKMEDYRIFPQAFILLSKYMLCPACNHGSISFIFFIHDTLLVCARSSTSIFVPSR